MLFKQLKKIITSVSPEDLEATLSTLRKIFDNIIQHSNDERYRQIKLANKTFSSKVWRYPVCEELMKMSGWVVEDDHVRLRDDSHIHVMSQLLESLCGLEDIKKPEISKSVTKLSVDKYEALILAAINSNISYIQNLLKPCCISRAGMIYSENDFCTNLLYVSMLSQSTDVVELLVKEYSLDAYVADDDGDLMVFKVFTISSQSFIISFLKICGVNGFFKIFGTDFTLLHHAIFTCCFDVVCFLVEVCGTDVNITTDDLDTPLHIAYMTGNTHVAEYLIKHGANVALLNSRGHIPYDYSDGDTQSIALSQGVKNKRIIHQVPGSAEFMYYIKLCKSAS